MKQARTQEEQRAVNEIRGWAIASAIVFFLFELAFINKVGFWLNTPFLNGLGYRIAALSLIMYILAPHIAGMEWKKNTLSRSKPR